MPCTGHRCGLTPEVLEPIRRQLGVTHGVLDVFVAEPRLQRPRVVAGIGQGVAAETKIAFDYQCR